MSDRPHLSTIRVPAPRDLAQGRPGDSAVPPGDERISMEVVTAAGRAAPIEFRIRPQTVEVWRIDARCGVLRRDVLHAWLRRPEQPMMDGDFAFVVDLHRRISIVLPDVRPWPLAPSTLARLHALV